VRGWNYAAGAARLFHGLQNDRTENLSHAITLLMMKNREARIMKRFCPAAAQLHRRRSVDSLHRCSVPLSIFDNPVPAIVGVHWAVSLIRNTCSGSMAEAQSAPWPLYWFARPGVFMIIP